MDRDTLIKRMLADAKTTRRQFMVGATAFGLSAATASSIWTKAQAATPKKGGHLKAALVGGSTTDSLDQQAWNDTYMITVGRSTRDSLVEVGQDKSAQPGLAESWETGKDASEWRFKIRTGVEFSNGKTLTPEDCVASINVHRGESSKSGAKGVFAAITDVKADGNVVVVTLSGPNADFPFLLTDYHMNVVPAPGGTPDLGSGIGTGIYKITKHDPGVVTQLERHKNAWQADKFGFVDSAEILGVPDPNARQNALVAGDVHAINKPDLKTVRLLATNPNVTIIDAPANSFFTSAMMVDQKPFDNIDFRRAMKYGIDRQQFIDKIVYGFGSIGNDHPIGPGFIYHAADIPQNTFDPDKAKHHLKKSGHEGVTIDYSASDTAYPGSLDFAALMKDVLAPIGININVVRESNDGYWDNVWLKKSFVAVNWGSRPVEDMILSINFLSDAAWNDTHWSSPRVDELVKAARGELDTKKRAEMYKEVQLIISQDGGTIVPAHSRDVAAVSSNVGTTGQYGGGWEMDGGHFVKRWWLNG